MNLFGKIKLFREKARRHFYDVFFGLDEILTVVNKHILQIGGEISEIKIEEDKSRRIVAVTAQAKMKIVNRSEVSITLINPKYLEQSDIKYFAPTKESCCGSRGNIYSLPCPKDFLENRFFSEFLKTFEENSSSENLMICLEPQEEFIWNEDIYFEFGSVNTKRIWQGLGWNQFRSAGDLLWFCFEYRLPPEIFSAKPKLLEIFPESWKTDAEIPIARYQIRDISGQKNVLETAPILIDFTQAIVQESKDNDER